MISADHVWLLAIALVLDALVGDPDFVWRRVPHPVVLMGGLIDTLDRTLNTRRLSGPAKRALGIFATVVAVIAAGGIGYALEALFRALPDGWIWTAAAASVLLAGRSLYDHVAAVARPLASGDLPAARAAVALIVGRDTDALDEAGISRAAIESLAESFCDGVVAPALWFLLLGLPGMAAYKAINTADSMIGHRTERYADFGWAAARLDDLVNLPASRLAGALIVLAPPSWAARTDAFRVMLHDARRHASPNAGWPEAAMAGVLGVALGGPKTYGGVPSNDAWLNGGGRRDAGVGDVRRALRIYLGAAGILLGIAIAGFGVRFV